MKKIIILIFSFLSFICAPVIGSAQDVKIGVIYPLTGSSAQIGKDAIAAIETALDIINNSHNIPGMPLAKDAGLKGLDGAKITIVIGDHAGKPCHSRANHSHVEPPIPGARHSESNRF